MYPLTLHDALLISSRDSPRSETVVCFSLRAPLKKCERSPQVATCKKYQLFSGPKVGTDKALDMQLSTHFSCMRLSAVRNRGLFQPTCTFEKMRKIATGRDL